MPDPTASYPLDAQVTYTLADVARVLHISRPTVYRLIERGDLKTFSVSDPEIDDRKRDARRVSHQELCACIGRLQARSEKRVAAA